MLFCNEQTRLKYLLGITILGLTILGSIASIQSGWFSRSRSDEGFLQFDRIEILQDYSYLAPGKQFGGDFYSRNPGPGRVFNAYGYSQAFIADVDEETDHRVRILFDQKISPIRAQYLEGKIKGPEEGVGQGIWTTVLTHPLTQGELEGILKGTTRIYYVSWLAWTDSEGHKASAYDCRWLQAHTLAAPYKKEDIVWHFCLE